MLNKKTDIGTRKFRESKVKQVLILNANRKINVLSAGERPSTCDVCGSSFYDDVYLKEHMRLHTGDTPHKCPVCARGYAQRGNMKSHMRNHKISELTPDTLAKIKPNYLKFMRP